MPRPAPVITLDAEQKAALRHLLGAPTTPQGLALRLAIVLKAAEGESNQAIASRLAVTSATVGKWRHAFSARGLEGLRDRARSGRPRKYGPEALERIRAGVQHLRGSRFGVSVRALARDTNIPRSTVHHLLTAPHRRQPVRTDRGPHNAAAPIVAVRGIYLTRTEGALVIGTSDMTGDGPTARRVLGALEGVARPRKPLARPAAAALLEATDASEPWRPGRGKPRTLANFLSALTAQREGEHLHVIRTGRGSASRPRDPGVLDLPRDVWYDVAHLCLRLFA